MNSNTKSEWKCYPRVKASRLVTTYSEGIIFAFSNTKFSFDLQWRWLTPKTAVCFGNIKLDTVLKLWHINHQSQHVHLAKLILAITSGISPSHNVCFSFTKLYSWISYWINKVSIYCMYLCLFNFNICLSILWSCSSAIWPRQIRTSL